MPLIATTPARGHEIRVTNRCQCHRGCNMKGVRVKRPELLFSILPLATRLETRLATRLETRLVSGTQPMDPNALRTPCGCPLCAAHPNRREEATHVLHLVFHIQAYTSLQETCTVCVLSVRVANHT